MSAWKETRPEEVNTPEQPVDDLGAEEAPVAIADSPVQDDQRASDKPPTSAEDGTVEDYQGEPDLTSLPAPLLIKQSRALQMLEDAEGRDEILDVLLKFASQAFEFSVLMVVHQKSAQGRHAVLRGRPPIPAEQVSLPLDQGGMFGNVFATKGYHLGPPTDTDSEDQFYRSIGRDAPNSCALLPVVLRGRVILLFYGDSGERGVKANRVARLAEFARSVSSAFEKLLLRQKYGQYEKKESAEGKIVPETKAVAPKKKDFSSWGAADDEIGAEGWPAPSRASSLAAVESVPASAPVPVPEPMTPEETAPTMVPEAPPDLAPEPVFEPEPVPESEPVRDPVLSSGVLVMTPEILGSTAPEGVITEQAPEPYVIPPEAVGPTYDERGLAGVAGADRVTEPAETLPSTLEERLRSAASPDPELVKRVETITVRSAPAAEPSVESFKRVIDPAGAEAATLKVSAVADDPVDPYADSEPPPPQAVTPTIADPASAQEPPAEEQRVPQASAEPRSVEVLMPEELDRLIERVMSRGAFDQAASDLLVGMGDDSLKRLVPNFPGPLNFDRYQETSRLRRVGQHGPLLRALLEFGPGAGRHLMPLLDSFDSEVRFYAVFIFSEIEYPEALSILSKRLFDNDRQIRILAMDVMRKMYSFPEYRWAVQETALVLTNSSSNLEKKRMAAEALGELQDPVAIKALAEMLGSVDGILAERCQRALVKITFDDFGFSERRWLAWLQANRNHHRIEWAMNSINHRVEDIRRAALDELRRLVGDSVEWPRGPLDHRQRREVKRRCLQWWEREGRALNPIVDLD